MYAKCTRTHSYPTVTPQGPRSLHFRGKRPIPRLQKLASSCARPAAALRDHPVCPRQCGIPELTDLLDPSTLTSDEESDCRLGHLRNKTASTFSRELTYKHIPNVHFPFQIFSIFLHGHEAENGLFKVAPSPSRRINLKSWNPLQHSTKEFEAGRQK